MALNVRNGLFTGVNAAREVIKRNLDVHFRANAWLWVGQVNAKTQALYKLKHSPLWRSVLELIPPEIRHFFGQRQAQFNNAFQFAILIKGRLVDQFPDAVFFDCINIRFATFE